ncbi:MAG: ribulose-phosphate 3-epimerase [Rickettsiaceae bacterium]|jgi:ribulose-phosphate 3-epimerase|nr:ribulose-phosphate 3-epimerase [Rickettsiaceae bacterium]
MKRILVAPSILSADFARLGEEVRAITEAGADMIHIDVMDGCFVPNLTIGPDVVRAIRKYSNLPFDVHLMIDSPEKFIKPFVEAGADIITVHFEAEKHIDKLLTLIKSLNVKAGISLLPSTNPQVLEYIIDYLDLILVMSVNPGFGGQKFIASQLNKVRDIKNILDKKAENVIISVDGGVNDKNVSNIIEAGANMIVAGSYIFSDGSDQYKKRIEILKNGFNKS